MTKRGLDGTKTRRRSPWILRLGALAFALAVALIGAVSARAQGEAAIEGAVSDPSGAAIAGSNVTVKNVETGTVRAVVTDLTGRYDAPLLPVGSYEVTATKTGFEAESKSGITLVIGQRAEIDITLPVGEVQQDIQVTEQAITLSVSTADTSGLVGEQQVKDLPLNGRSYDQLLTLNPGVVNYTSQRSGGIGTSNSAVGNMFSASGHRPQDNLYLLNGVEFTGASEINNTPGGVSGQLLGVDAVREFEVVKDAYGAEYGKRPGAQINIVTASGTNQLHGNVYEFLRNSALDSRNFFDPAQIPQFQRNVFGASLGGPLKKDKSFLFANYEGFRQRLGLSDVTLEPDAAAQSHAVASIQPLLALWPAITPANSKELLDASGNATGIAEVLSSPKQSIREDFGTARFDQNFSDNDVLAASYTGDDSAGHSPTTNPLSFVDISLREQVASVTETHIFSTHLVNKATFGYSRGAFAFNSGVSSVDLPGWIHAGQPVGAIVVGGGTTLNGASQLTNAGTNAGSNLNVARNLFTVTDQVLINHGRHEIEAGVWLERLQSNDTLIQDQYGQASFTNLQTFLAGTVSTFTYAPSFTPLSWRSLEGAFYAEDAIRLTTSLELRVGFRGESTNGWNEAHGRAANFGFDASGVVETQPAVGDSVFTANEGAFLPAPRVSVAWSPFGAKNTVIRAGAGLYYALNDALSYRLDQIGPFNSVFAAKNIAFASISPAASQSGTAGYAGAKVVPSGVQSNLQTPTVESYTLKIEQQLWRSATLSVGYIGSRGYHEILSVDANVPVPAVCPASPCPSSYTYFNGTTVAIPASTAYNPAGAPLANSAVLNTTHWLSEGVSNYNGLEVDISQRLSDGLQFRGVYTYAKTLDDGDSLNTSIATNSPAFTANPLAPMLDYGRASFDVRHSAVINATYDLPFGHTKRWARGAWGDRVLGNWQVSGIETLLSGLPFTPQLSYNPANDGDARNPVRPSWNPSFSGPVILGGPNEYFNPAAFAVPVPGTYGNVGRNVLQGPGLAQLDVSLAKKIPMGERVTMQFRAEFFNLLNRTNFNTPNPVVFTNGPTSVGSPFTNESAAYPFGIPSPTAGLVTSTATSSRQIQFGVKLLW